METDSGKNTSPICKDISCSMNVDYKFCENGRCMQFEILLCKEFDPIVTINTYSINWTRV